MRVFRFVPFVLLAFVITGCGESSSSEDTGGPEEPTREETTQQQYDPPASSDPQLSESDLQGLNETECVLAKAEQGLSQAEIDALGQEIADEVVETDKDIVEIMAERGVTC